DTASGRSSLRGHRLWPAIVNISSATYSPSAAERPHIMEQDDPAAAVAVEEAAFEAVGQIEPQGVLVAQRAFQPDAAHADPSRVRHEAPQELAAEAFAARG